MIDVILPAGCALDVSKPILMSVPWCSPSAIDKCSRSAENTVSEYANEVSHPDFSGEIMMPRMGKLPFND